MLSAAITVTLLAQRGVVKVGRLEGGTREQTITLTPALLTKSKVPALNAENYPGLAPLATATGVSVTTTPSGQLEGRVSDLELARENGLGLEKPTELRKVGRLTVPSPTEVVESIPSLLSRSLLLGKPPEDEVAESFAARSSRAWMSVPCATS